MHISKGNDQMIDLIARLKVTTATQVKPATVQAKLPASIKIPGPTTIKVAPIVEPSAGKPVVTDHARDLAFVDASIRNKMAECKPKVDIGINEDIIAKYRDEYQQFLKELETMDFSSMIFGQPTAQATVPAAAPVAQEEVPLANGISVGEEAGGSIVIPTTTTPKKSRKKKVVTEEVQTDATEAPAEVAEAPAEA